LQRRNKSSKKEERNFHPTLDLEFVLSNFEIKNEFLLHAGAHLCQESQLYNDYGFKRVLWLEAFPQAIQEAERLLTKFPKQEICHALLWSKDGEIRKFHVAKGAFSSSTLQMKRHRLIWPGSKYVESLQMTSCTLDSLAKPKGISNVSLLVVDVQGAELEVLKGAVSVLANTDYIYIEIAVLEIYSGQAKSSEISNFLRSQGFFLLAYEINPYTGDGNALFSRTFNSANLDLDSAEKIEEFEKNFRLSKGQIFNSWLSYCYFRIYIFFRNCLRFVQRRERVRW
jgi:FkbM family methyltransferase